MIMEPISLAATVVSLTDVALRTSSALIKYSRMLSMHLAIGSFSLRRHHFSLSFWND
jgi:hypothetical protein